MLAFMFGGSIAAVFMIVLTIACIKILAELIGFPTDEVSFIINMIIKYFWPAFLAGGFLTGVTKKKRFALMAAVVWLLILVLFCFVPGNVTVPKAEDVARLEITYPTKIFQVDEKISYDYSGFGIKDPAVIAEVIDIINGGKYTFTHQILLTKGEWNYDRVFLEFKDAEGETLKKMTLIRDTGIKVEGFIDRFYRIKKNSGLDVQRLYDLAHNGY